MSPLLDSRHCNPPTSNTLGNWDDARLPLYGKGWGRTRVWHALLVRPMTTRPQEDGAKTAGAIQPGKKNRQNFSLPCCTSHPPLPIGPLCWPTACSRNRLGRSAGPLCAGSRRMRAPASPVRTPCKAPWRRIVGGGSVCSGLCVGVIVSSVRLQPLETDRAGAGYANAGFRESEVMGENIHSLGALYLIHQ